MFTCSNCKYETNVGGLPYCPKCRVELGSISHGTMRPEDLIPCFLDELKRIDPSNALIAEIESRMKDEDYFDSEEAMYDLNEGLFDALDALAPPYAYFGAHEGDGSDYGFWLSYESIESAVIDGDIVKVNAGDDFPRDADEVLEVSDHGNMALYVRDQYGDWKEVWAVV